MLPTSISPHISKRVTSVGPNSSPFFVPTTRHPVHLLRRRQISLLDNPTLRLEQVCRSVTHLDAAINVINRLDITAAGSHVREPGATYEMYENLFKNPLHRVFVYGTLKRGEPNHGIIKDVANGYAKFLGVGKTTTSYPLVIATKYNIPFLLKKPNVGNHVQGEVYDVDSAMLNRLDELEEHPAFYERTEEEVLLAPVLKPGKTFEEVGQLTKAWVYFLPRYNPSLLEAPMYASYSNSEKHKYCENDEDSSSIHDVL